MQTKQKWFIRLALDYQQKYDITLDKISKELAELRKSYNKLEPDLAITKAVNKSLRNQILTSMPEQCSIVQTRNSGNIWWNTRKYWRWWARGESVDCFIKTRCQYRSTNCWSMSLVYVKQQRQEGNSETFQTKDSDEIRRVRSKLNTTDLKPLTITTSVYINGSLCFYYKKLWSKCKKLW